MLYAQYGHQPSDKVTEGLKRGLLNGVVLEPRTHQPEKLKEVIAEIREIAPKADLLFDTNFHALSLPAQDSIGKIGSYPFYYASLASRLDFTSKKISEYVSKVCDYQTENKFSKILSPSVIFASFTSYWAQIAIQLYLESLDYAKKKGFDSKLLLTLPIGESALREDKQLSDFLDDLTTIETRGFFIIVDRSTQNAPQWSDPTTLSGLLYMINVLSENDYEVVLGHTDLVGVLAKAVGANSIANGWWKNLKQFSRNRYMGKRGGRPPRPTYTSETLLNSVFIDPELQQITELGLAEEIMALDKYDKTLKSDPVSQTWTRTDSALQHWSVTKKLLEKIDDSQPLETRIETVKDLINDAQTAYSEARKKGVGFDYISGPAHLKVWLDAINLFQQGL